jgi:hypothetical protein
MEAFLFSGTALSPRLIRAYCETCYKVLAPDELTLLVGHPNPDLVLVQQRYQADCSAFITACNPFSAALSKEKNVARQKMLAAELQSQNLAFVEGVGQHPANGWAGEPSFLVFGLGLDAAKILCTRFEQNGFVWSGGDGVPRLILLR